MGTSSASRARGSLTRSLSKTETKRQKETKSTSPVSWVAALRWFHPTAEGGPTPCESQVVCLRQRTSRLPQLSQRRASITLNSATPQRIQHVHGQARRRDGHMGKCGETKFERTTAASSETARSWQCEELRSHWSSLESCLARNVSWRKVCPPHFGAWRCHAASAEWACPRRTPQAVLWQPKLPRMELVNVSPPSEPSLTRTVWRLTATLCTCHFWATFLDHPRAVRP